MVQNVLQHEKAQQDVQYRRNDTRRRFNGSPPKEDSEDNSCPRVAPRVTSSAEIGIQTCKCSTKEESVQTVETKTRAMLSSNSGGGSRGGSNRMDLMHASNPLSREKILMLLEQAQISSPLYSRRLGRISDSSDLDSSDIIGGGPRQVSNYEKMLLAETGCFC